MRKILFVILLIINSCIGFAQTLNDQIFSILKPYVEFDQFHGRVLVAKNGEIIFNEGFGYANMEWQIPSRPETKYRIASISKQFTALIILQLVSEGRIDLNHKITDYLPDYRKETGDKVTVHQLLVHTSGIPNGDRTINGFWSSSEHTLINYSKKDFIKKFCCGDLEFEPGTEFRYSSVGYMILGAIIEEVCGKSFTEVFDERVVKKIGLNNTTCDDNISLVPNRASGYFRDNLGWENSKYHYMPILDGAGTVLTTVGDLYKYDQALYTDDLLPKDYIPLFFEPNSILNKGNYYGDGKYSYGWAISYLKLNTTDSVKIISHKGGIRGGSGFFLREIDQNNTVIILSNTEIGSPTLQNIGLDIVRILNNAKPLNDVHIPIRQIIGKEIIENGIDSAIEKYNILRNSELEIFDFRENQLNSLGYSLINYNMIDEAIKIFELNVKVYPTYANGYDSLAEAYFKNGQKDLAIENYRKSLELNPENANAKEMLIKLKN